MKKGTFIVLLVLELFGDMLAMGLLLNSIGAYCYLVAAVLFALVLTPFFLALKKTEEEEKKRKIRRNMFLVMLIPMGVALAVILYFLICMMIYFA